MASATPEPFASTGSAQSAEPAESATAATESESASGLAAMSAPAKCFDQGECQIGDSGPGGGIVFHDAGSVQEWGRYLEAAPEGWSGRLEDPKAVWCDQSASRATTKTFTREGIGEGLGNAERIFKIQRCAPSSAMGMARDYLGAGLNDWYLPAKDEVLALNEAGWKVGGETAWLWTSSRTTERAALIVVFGITWKLFSTAFPSMAQVPPIRAF